MILDFGGSCKVVPEEYIQMEDEDERYFYPGVLHGGNYLLQAFAYYGEDNTIRVEVVPMFPQDILDAAKETLEQNGYLSNNDFMNALNERCENFLCENREGDPCFDALNDNWLAYGVQMTMDELIAWATVNA